MNWELNLFEKCEQYSIFINQSFINMIDMLYYDINIWKYFYKRIRLNSIYVVIAGIGSRSVETLNIIIILEKILVKTPEKVIFNLVNFLYIIIWLIRGYSF